MTLETELGACYGIACPITDWVFVMSAVLGLFILIGFLFIFFKEGGGK